MPVFEGLFDSNDEVIIMNVLYLLCNVHALAKLRLHTDATLTSLMQMTVRFGNALRLFHTEVCHKFETKELQQEAQKRARREADRSFRDKGDDGFEADESTLLGGGDSFRDQYVACIFPQEISTEGLGPNQFGA